MRLAMKHILPENTNINLPFFIYGAGRNDFVTEKHISTFLTPNLEGQKSLGPLKISLEIAH
jgi:hypothetical protein